MSPTPIGNGIALAINSVGVHSLQRYIVTIELLLCPAVDQGMIPIHK